MILLSRWPLFAAAFAAGLIVNLANTATGTGPVGGSTAWANEDDHETSGGKREGRKIKRITGTGLVNMSDAALKKFGVKVTFLPSDSDPVYIIAGYSRKASQAILGIAADRPSLAKRLLRKLKTVTDPKQRAKILKAQKERLQKEYDAHLKSVGHFLEQMDKAKTPAQRSYWRNLEDAESTQMVITGRLIEQVDQWIKAEEPPKEKGK